MVEENGSGKLKLKDLTRCNLVFLSVLRVEVKKIVPIMRFKKQKRTVGVNQEAIDSIMVSLYVLALLKRRCRIDE